ncbi:hypothetical protein GGR57DRAFT_481290 [Xylariaceae sp. FL1272]|nr:hypothetical protein GGR57DRAFT_481290 [Xylariaceae sp. FL1272]
MPSVKNPNGPSKNRLAARRATARKISAKHNTRATLGGHKIAKADARRGARTGLLPTSGPNRALGGKQAKKLERKMKHALKRKMEAEGEVEMKDAGEESAKSKGKGKSKKGGADEAEDSMAVDEDTIT